MSLASRVAQDAGVNPTVIGLLVRISGRAVCNRAYETLIANHTRDGEFLKAVCAQLKTECQAPSPQFYFGGEIVSERIGLRQASSLHDLLGSSDDQPSSYEKSAFGLNFLKDAADASLIRHWHSTWLAFPRSADNWNAVETAMLQRVKEGELDRSITSFLNAILIPVFAESANSVLTVQAHDNLLQTSVALLQARLKGAPLPRFLPKTLGKIATDPFSGEQLRYKRHGTGFLLYSIGRDRTDDGGKRRDPKHLSADG
jgi:hypothetical protein